MDTIIKFDIDKLAQSLQKSCPEVIFALLHGSAKDGFVKQESDIDIALYINGIATFELYSRAGDAVREIVDFAQPDIGILNNAEPIYKFEALKGKLLFNNDFEKYVSFFSLTCRQYESQMADYQRQKLYRLQAQKERK